LPPSNDIVPEQRRSAYSQLATRHGSIAVVSAQSQLHDVSSNVLDGTNFIVIKDEETAEKQLVVGKHGTRFNGGILSLKTFYGQLGKREMYK
jgi:hypothetical protein